MRYGRAGLFIGCVAWGAATLAADGDDEMTWHVPSATYRVPLTLSEPLDGAAVVAIDPHDVIEAMRSVAVDPLDEQQFAYERATVVNPRTGRRVGGFQLVPTGPAMPIDGSFQGLADGDSPWHGFLPDRMSIERMVVGNASRHALVITKDQITNQKLEQTVPLQGGERYLLEYWITMDVQDNLPVVMLYDPALQLFAEHPHSYFNKMPPRGEWAHRRVIVWPRGSGPIEASLQVTHAFTGTAAVADIRLRPVAWRLIVEPDEPTDKLVIYAGARAGHRYTQPDEGAAPGGVPATRVLAQLGQPQCQPINRDAVYVAGDGITAWTVDPHLPLTVDALPSYKPTASYRAEAARVDLFRGGSASLVIALDVGQPRIDAVVADADLPVKARFTRLARIPVYPGPHPLGDYPLMETRYDAMVPLDFTLDPDAGDGRHLVVVTLTADDQTPAGRHRGWVALDLAGQRVVIPVDLRVAPLTINPMRHFGTLFGGQHFLTRYSGSPFTEESVTVAEFHGLEADGLEPPSAISLATPDDPDPRTLNVRNLAERYFHAMIDHHVLPQSPGLYAYFDYDVVDREPDQAPQLTNWDFTQGYDRAVEEFVIGRDMPWLTVGHSNGYFMDKIRLNNAKTYSVKPNPGQANWVHLSREQFDRLVGTYWEGIARHLAELGVLDRAIFVIDESGPETFETIRMYVEAMRAQPHAARIRIGHTMYKPSAWTHRDADGELILDDILDVPMPDNDDEFNFFEPEWNQRYDTTDKSQWVYYVETDHMNLHNAGLSTVFAPLKLRHFGADGWYCWASFIWSMPYPYEGDIPGGFQYPSGPVANPWVNPFYHHGPGVLSFFYPPDPRGPAEKPTSLVIPSYRLALMRDGIQLHALLDVIERGTDDMNQTVTTDPRALETVKQHLATLWADNPVQWYLDYDTHRTIRCELFDLAMESER